MEFRKKYWFLSNMFPCKVEFEGEIYKSSESAFQSAKCKNLTDRKGFVKIGGFVAKRLGRTVELREDWLDVRVDIMEQILRSKFSDNDLAQKLINTGDIEIVEDNTWGDTFWGRYKGFGENILGKILMKIRDEIKERK